MAKLLYKPFAILSGALAGRLARRLFNAIWARIDSREPPLATHEQASLGKVVGAATLEAVVFTTTRAAIDRASARTFANLTGLWPGDREPPEKEQETD
jgi:uncharacterized protein DUF4235